MRSVDFQDGMKASFGKTGADPAVTKGRLQKYFSQGVPIEIVII
jgi:hypothetical protein